MKVEIKTSEKNPMLERTEIEFTVENAEKTPSRKELREKIASLANSKPENLIIDSISHNFGTMQVLGKARVYESREALERIELPKQKRKNFPEKFQKKEEKAAEAEAGKEAAGAKKEEKKQKEKSQDKKEAGKETGSEKKEEKASEEKKEEKK